MNIKVEFIVVIVVIVAGALGWLINKGVDIVAQLIVAVNEFRVVMSALKEFTENMNENDTVKHTIVDERLKAHAAKIEAHGLILAEHEIKIKQLEK
ncbi:MAG: hypothetical protein WCJ61_01745 [Paludibacter sp.]